jgi:hypothetical protein
VEVPSECRQLPTQHLRLLEAGSGASGPAEDRDRGLGMYLASSRSETLRLNGRMVSIVQCVSACGRRMVT